MAAGDVTCSAPTHMLHKQGKEEAWLHLPHCVLAGQASPLR